jgi:hypothetical protein
MTVLSLRLVPGHAARSGHAHARLASPPNSQSPWLSQHRVVSSSQGLISSRGLHRAASRIESLQSPARTFGLRIAGGEGTKAL